MSAAFWSRIAELEHKVEMLAEAIETGLTPLIPCLANIEERLNALEAKRPPGRPRKVEDSAA